MAAKEQNSMAWLQEKGQLQEQPFTSTVPLFGPLIVWFRTMWNSVAAKWIIRRLIQQQNEFNGLILQEIGTIEDQIFEQVIEQDREQTALIREMGEINLQVRQINRVLEAIEERLARLEGRGEVEVGLEEE
jgi:hypothetical protein